MIDEGSHVSFGKTSVWPNTCAGMHDNNAIAFNLSPIKTHA